MILRKSFVFIGFILLLIAYLIYLEINYQSKRKITASSNINPSYYDPDLDANKVIWFARKLNPNNPWGQIQKEWHNNEFLKKSPDITNLWIPLNDHDSQKLELQWRRFVGFNACQNVLPFFDEEIILMNGMYNLHEINEQYFTLKPIYWKMEKDMFIVVRSECVYEVSSIPPMLYVSQIEPDLNKQSKYYQPIPCSYAKNEIMETRYINNIVPQSQKHPTYEHVVIAIHGIGHYESEESVVENANNIREGFMNFKKFDNDYPMPMVIPIAWRHTLPLNDEVIEGIRLTKDEQSLKLLISVIDVLYYNAAPAYRDEMKNELIQQIRNKLNLFLRYHPNFSGKISFLAHSLGSLIAFDILQEDYEKLGFEVENLFFIGSPLPLFLAIRNITGEKLRENKWIKEKALFNIIHTNDPIAFRFEPLLFKNYRYTEPFKMNFHRHFRNNFWRYAVSNVLEKDEIYAFLNRLIDDRNVVTVHDSFKIAVLPAYDSTNCQLNYFINPNLHSQMTQNVGRYNRTIPKEQRITYRMDYDIHENGIVDQIEAAIWGKELPFAHISYWQRPEVIMFMLNIIYNYTPPLNADIVESPYGMLEFCAIASLKNDLYLLLLISFWILLSFYLSYRQIFYTRASFHYMFFNNYGRNLFKDYCTLILALVEVILFFIYAAMIAISPFLLRELFSIFHILEYNFGIPSYYQYVIFGIIFIPSTINFLMIDASFSFKYSKWLKNVVLTIQLIWIVLYLYSKYVEFYRRQIIQCRVPVDDYCLTYFLYYNQTEI